MTSSDFHCPSSDFHCPFCQQTSVRPQGLAAHIRNRHAKQYPKWLKLPTRIVDAQRGAAAPESIEPVVRKPSAAPQSSPAPAPSPLAAGANPALDLLKQAHSELASRKVTIEGDLARMSDLTKELEAVNAQIQALEKTLAVFEPQQR